MSCDHAEAIYGWTGDSWSKACPSCGLKTRGSHPSAEEADGEWKKISRPRLTAETIADRVALIRIKEASGEKLTDLDEVFLAYAPSSVGGHAPACASAVVRVRPE